MLLLGWSVLEGLGACLIMPTVIALIAGNFTGRARAGAYGTIAAAAAVAVGLGPIIGGFVTAYYSWRWVFAGGGRHRGGHPARLADHPRRPPTSSPASTSWARCSRRPGIGPAGVRGAPVGQLGRGAARGSRKGPTRHRRCSGISAVTWLVAGGLLLLLAFVAWQRRRARAGPRRWSTRRCSPTASSTCGLSVLVMQYLVMMGMHLLRDAAVPVAVPGPRRVRHRRAAAAAVARPRGHGPAVPKLLPRASPRRVVQGGLLLMLVASLLLAARLEEGADAAITTLPFLLLGAGMGAMASQLGNVIVSSAPVERGSEVGGLQYSAQNLGSSLGTALIGAVVIAALATLTIQGIQASPQLSEPTKQSLTAAFGSGVDFVSDADVEAALTEAGLRRLGAGGGGRGLLGCPARRPAQRHGRGEPVRASWRSSSPSACRPARWTAAGPAPGAGSAPAPRPPELLLVVLDGLRVAGVHDVRVEAELLAPAPLASRSH